MHSRLLLPMALGPSESMGSNHLNQYRGLGRARGLSRAQSNSKSNSTLIPSVPNQLWTRLTGQLLSNQNS